MARGQNRPRGWSPLQPNFVQDKEEWCDEAKEKLRTSRPSWQEFAEDLAKVIGDHGPVPPETFAHFSAADIEEGLKRVGTMREAYSDIYGLIAQLAWSKVGVPGSAARHHTDHGRLHNLFVTCSALR